MRHMTRIISGLAGAALLSGCTLGMEAPPSNVSAGSLAKYGDLSGVELTVGGKEFTEQLVLCEVVAQVMESVGAEVERSCGMSGTASVRAALLSGDIDMYWEYTGTGWITHLGKTDPADDPQKLYKAVAERDEEKNSIKWLEPAPADNTYAVAVTREKAKQLGVETISDYAELARKDPASASFCGAAEFFGRGDGWPGLQKAYNFELPDQYVSELAAGAIYNSIDKARPCVFGEVFATDGRIAALDLVILEDNKNYFTAYNPSLTVRSKVFKEHPAIADIIAPVAEQLDSGTLQMLNAKVDVEGATAQQAAKEWLVKKGFVSE